MSSPVWSRWRKSWTRWQGGRTPRRPPRILLRLEELEQRLAPATTFSIAAYSVVEPAPNGTVNLDFAVTRTGDLTSQVTIGYTTVAGTAQAGRDFAPETGTTTFASGSSTATIAIPIFGNGLYENPSLTFSVQLTGITNVVGPPVTLSAQPDVVSGFSPVSVAVGDVNGDGKPDLVVTYFSDDTVSVLVNTTPPGATTPTFAAPVNMPVGYFPHAVAIADVNGDGLPDLVVVSAGGECGGYVSVLLNTTTPQAATPSFASQATFAVGYGPTSLAVADLNGDGLPDLVVANSRDNDVSVLLNTTTPGADVPTFSPQQTFATGMQPISVAVGDFNGDGRPDLAVANFTDETVSVLLNTTTPGTSTPTFAPQQTFATGMEPVSVAAADLNGDGLPDLVVANYGDSTVSVLLNTTTPGAAAPSFAPQTTVATGPYPASVAVADLNGDGKPDLVVADFGYGPNAISVLVNTTAPGALAPSFATKADFTTYARPSSVVIADLNGDGKPDVVLTAYGVVTDPYVMTLLNTTVLGAAAITPDFPQSGTAAVSTGPISVAIGDVNGDGLPDLVVANRGSDNVAVLLNTTAPGATAPSFAAPQDFAAGSQPFSVAIADLNGDGKPDLVVANIYDATVSVLLNTTAPGATTLSFAAQQTFAVESGPESLAIADLNGDGRPDIVVANASDATVSVLVNTTTPGATTLSFAAQQTFAVGSLPLSVAIGDLNGDGRPDLVVANYDDNDVSVLLNTTAPGATTLSFAAQQAFAVGSNPRSVAIGDLNGDGIPDLVVANRSSNTVSVLLNTTTPGATTPSFAPQVTFATGSSPFSVAIGDLNGDGRPDVVVANSNEDAVSVLLNTTTPGATTPSFAAKADFAVGISPLGVAIGDFNGDGRPDIAVADYNSNYVSVLLNAPETITQATAVVTIVESDPEPTVSLASATQTVNENDGTFTVTVNLSAASGVDTTVPFTLSGTAVAGVNYSGVTTTPLVIAAGQTTGTITGTLIDDGKYNTTNNTLTFSLGSPTNATVGTNGSDTLTIQESDPEPSVSFAAATQCIAENAAAPLTVTVNLSAASDVDTIVPITFGGTAVRGTDYTVCPSSVTILAGQTSATFTLTPIDDGYSPTDKTVQLGFCTPTNATVGAPRCDLVTIKSDPEPSVSFAAATQCIAENAAVPLTVTVNLSAASDVDTIVPITFGGTAVRGTDYTVCPSSVTILAGQTSATFTLTPIDDGYSPTDKTVQLGFCTPTNATVGAPRCYDLVTIKSDPEPSVSFAAATQCIAENAAVPLTVTVNLSAPSDVDTIVPITFGGTAVRGTDYTVCPSCVTILAGQTSATFTLTPIDDGYSPTDKTVQLGFCTPTNATVGMPRCDLVTIKSDPEPSVSFAAATQCVAENAAAAADGHGQPFGGVGRGYHRAHHIRRYGRQRDRL